MDQTRPPVRPRQVKIAVGLLLAALAASAIYLGWFWRPPQVLSVAVETLRLLLLFVNLGFAALYLALLWAHRWALLVTVAIFSWGVLSFATALWRGAPHDAYSLTLALSGFAVRSVAIALLLTGASRRWFREARITRYADSGDTLPVDGAWRDATPRP